MAVLESSGLVGLATTCLRRGRGASCGPWGWPAAGLAPMSLASAGPGLLEPGAPWALLGRRILVGGSTRLVVVMEWAAGESDGESAVGVLTHGGFTAREGA